VIFSQATPIDTSSLCPREIGGFRAIKRVRPELDIYLLTDRQVEKWRAIPRPR
jgi:hypothetical protein